MKGRPFQRNECGPLQVSGHRDFAVARALLCCFTSDMNPYATIGFSIGTIAAALLGARLAAWHDAMVAHERRLATTGVGDACSNACPHTEAPALWLEAVETFGARARELTFLRSRAGRALGRK
jgi:hypothetical protein